MTDLPALATQRHGRKPCAVGSTVYPVVMFLRPDGANIFILFAL